MKIVGLVSLLIAMVFSMSGCGATKVYNVPKQEVISGKPDITKLDVYYAIKAAGTNLGWIIEKQGENTLKGTLYLRKHIAMVTIHYSKDTYSITYLGSSMLKYNRQNNTIHKNYNSWVVNLDKAIKDNLGSI